MTRKLKIILATTSLFALAGEMFGPIYAVFVKEIGGDLLTAGGAYGLFAFSTGLLMFLIAKYEDRVKHQERLIVFSNSIMCIGFLGYLFISKPIHLFIVQIILGVSSAIGSPVYSAVYSRAVDKKRAAFHWGAWESLWYMVAGMAAIIGGYLANLYGFRFIFVIMFVISLIGLFVSLLLLEKKR